MLDTIVTLMFIIGANDNVEYCKNFESWIRVFSIRYVMVSFKHCYYLSWTTTEEYKKLPSSDKEDDERIPPASSDVSMSVSSWSLSPSPEQSSSGEDERKRGRTKEETAATKVLT